MKLQRRRASRNSSIRLAVVGCGAITRLEHMRAIERAGLDPVLFVDADIAKAKDLAASRDGAESASDIRDIGDRVDAALVAVPHSLHCALAVELLRQQIHVLVEKPMALNRSECASMIDAATDADRILAVGLTRRQYSAIQWTHSLIDQGHLGDILSFHIWEGFRLAWPIESLSFFSKETNGGGVLVDTGAHTLDLADWLFGPLEVVSYVDDSEGGVEADCQIELCGPGRLTGTIDLSRTRNMRNVLSMETVRGGLIVDLYGRSIETSGGLRVPVRPPRRHRKETLSDTFYKQLVAWIAAIEGRESTYVSGAEAARSVGLIEDCYRVRQPLAYPWAATAGGSDGSRGSA